MKNRLTSIGIVGFLLIGAFVGFLHFESENAQGTIVSGSIFPPGETWDIAGSPYIVIGDVMVMSGATLTIDPGVEVKFDGYYSIDVNGTLIAIGTETNRINITSNMATPAPYDWHRIQIKSNGHADIEYCDISYATHAIYFFHSSNNMIANNNILKNMIGIHLESSSNLTIINNNIASNGYSGIYLSYSSNNTMMNNNIASNDHSGIYLTYSLNNTMMNNSIANNILGLRFANSDPNNTVTNNSLLGNAHFGIFSYEHVTAKFNYWGTTDLTKIERMVYNVDYSNPLSTDPTGMDLQFIGDAVWSGTIYIDRGTIINGNVAVTGATIVFNHSKEQNFIQVNGKMIVENSTLKSNSGLYTVLYTNNSMGYIKNSTIMEQRAISSEADGLTISGNELSQGYSGVVFMNGASKNYITNNKFLNNYFSSIEFFLSSNNIATVNIITNGVYGISIIESSNNIITKNKIFSNSSGTTIVVGMAISSSSNNIIANNIIYSTEYGIGVTEWSTNNTIVNNIIYSNKQTSIKFISSSYNLVMNNNISLSKKYGIYLVVSDKNNIINNNVSSNSLYGIYLFLSDGNNVTHNDVSSNIGYGIYLVDSLSNSLYHNNLLNNTFQAYDNTNNGNQWDNGYPSGGNYWSDFDDPSDGAYDDYEGIDQNVPGSDGIVDNGTIAGGGKNPYIIDSDSSDNYPLISPSGNFRFLYEGWNLISIPFIQSDTELGNVLSSITGSYTAVQWYNATDSKDPWKHNCTTKPYHLNDLYNIDHKMGFWIYITEPGGVLFEYTGTQPLVNQSINLHPGWNMVGYPSLSDRNRTEALSNLNFTTDVDSIWTYDAATLKWEEMRESDYFKVGRGYWIHSKVTKTWVVPL